MGLTTHQEGVLNESLEILKTSDRLLIKGSAGVGKTYMVDILIKTLTPTVRKGKKVYCSAPTHKALSVLKGKVEGTHLIEFITTHSALKLKRFINNKTGEVTFKPSYYNDQYPPLKECAIFIIDEASMLGEDLIEYIEDFATRFNVKVIFIGDNKQINPVGEENSKVFSMEYPEVELTEIIRQGKGNPIIGLSRNLDEIRLKQNELTNAEDFEESGDEIGYIHTRNDDKVVQELAEVNGTDDLKYLAWTNEEVSRMNFLVRRVIYGSPDKIEKGESLIFNSPYGEDFYTNEEIKVKDVGVEKCIYKYLSKNIKRTNETEVSEVELEVYYINGKLEDGKPTGIIVIHEDSETQYRTICNNLKNLAIKKQIEWRDYYSFMERFADLKYNHAITVHKSQGSTYKKAIVNIGNLNKNSKAKERKRLTYTAITRASDLLILYNS